MSDNRSNVYRERLKQRQRQEFEDKGKTGLGKKSVLNLSRKGIGEIKIFIPRYLPDKNEIDILPFEITQSWYQKLRMPSGRAIGLEVGDWDYKLQVPVHRGIGAAKDTYLCLREAFGGPCAICDDMFEAYKEGDKKKAADLRPSWRCFYNVFDYDDQEKGIQLFEIPYRTFEATSKNDPQRANLIDAMNLDPSGPVVFYDLQEGKTIIASFKKKVLGKQEFPEVIEIEFVDRDPYSEDIFQRVYPLDAMLIIPKPEEVKQAHYSVDDDGEELFQLSGEDDEKREESVSVVSSGKSRGRVKEEATSKKSDKEPEVKEEAPLVSSGRGRGRIAPPKEEPETPKCPAGGVFGQDCNKLPACEGNMKTSCDEKVFEACSAAFVIFQEEEKTKAEEAAKEKAASQQAGSPASGRRGRTRR